MEVSNYKKYKPSVIEWIEEVPEHWTIHRLKNIADVKFSSIDKHTYEDEEGVFLCNYVDVYKNEFINHSLSFMQGSASDAEIKKLQLKKGDVVVTKDSETPQDIAIPALVNEDLQNVVCGYHLAMIRPYKNLLGKYLFRIFQTKPVNAHFEVSANGITRYGLGVDAFTNLKVFLPPIEEQQTIAEYLDDQTKKIDHLIANKKAQAEKLKELRQIEINNAVTKGLNPNAEMKDSGIDWLGEIPRHWEVKRLKDLICKIGDGIHSTPNYVDASQIHFVNGNNLVNGDIKIFDTTDCIDENEYLKYKLDFNVGTLLISINGTIGNLAFYKGEKIVLGKSAAYIDYTYRLYNYYLYFFMQSYKVSNIFELSFSGTTIKNLSLFTLRNLRMFLPPKEEQIQIANYLQQRTTAIDKLINNIEVQIEKVQELRKIKIYEAVTGKIKVNAYAEATA